MDLVRNNQHIVGETQVGHAPQFVVRPNPAGRIVGMAQKEQANQWVSDFGFEIIEVDGVDVVIVSLQGTSNRFVSVVGGRAVEERVCRG